MRKWVVLPLVILALGCAAVSFAGTDKKFKMRVAVAPLDWSERESIDNWQIPVEFRTAIYEKLVKKLLDTERFVVLEREALDALLKEQAIKEANTGESQKGKVVPAQALVRGKVTDFSLNSQGAGGGVSVPGIGHVGGSVSQAKVGINVRIFDVETSELLASETAGGTANSAGFKVGVSLGSVFTDFGAYEKSPLGEATNKAIDDAVKKIVKKMEGQPWTAMVADWDGDASEMTINAGTVQGVAEGDVFEVVRVTGIVKDPETGLILRKKTTKVGSVKVKSAEAKFAVCEPVDGKEFKQGDLVRVPKAK